MMDSLQVDSLHVLAKTNAEKLDLGVSFENFNTGSLKLYKTNLTGFVANNQLNFDLGLRDKQGNPQYALGGLLSQIKNGVQFGLKDSLMLDHDHWSVAQGNFIQYDSVAGILVNNFAISRNGQSLSINSTEQTPNAPIKVDFNNFQIWYNHKNCQPGFYPGRRINKRECLVRDVMKTRFLLPTLQINNVIYKRDTIGNVLVKVNNEEANTYAANVSVKGNNTDVQLNGKYYTGESRMDFNSH